MIIEDAINSVCMPDDQYQRMIDDEIIWRNSDGTFPIFSGTSSFDILLYDTGLEDYVEEEKEPDGVILVEPGNDRPALLKIQFDDVGDLRQYVLELDKFLWLNSIGHTIGNYSVAESILNFFSRYLRGQRVLTGSDFKNPSPIGTYVVGSRRRETSMYSIDSDRFIVFSDPFDHTRQSLEPTEIAISDIVPETGDYDVANDLADRLDIGDGVLVGDETDLDCDICRRKVSANRMSRDLANCDHKFHSECLRNHLQQVLECPVCHSFALPPF